MNSMSRSIFVAALALTAVGLASAVRAQGNSPVSAGVTLFQSVRIFDGKSGSLSAPSSVLIKGNVIERISTAPIASEPGATVIAGGGRTLMPGLIDAHWHAMLVRSTPAEAIFGDLGYTNLVASAEATDTLMRGFTTVRDMAGPVFGLKRAIDEGVVVGPRVYPSGAMIATTGGHGDFRQKFELPRAFCGCISRMEQLGGAMIADSPDEVRRRVREQLLLGATQIKLAAGGGVASPYSPIDVSTFTEPELRAAVEAAENWGTYVAVHAYTPAAIQRAISAGVRCIEHGHLMDEATARLMAEKGIWLSTQPFLDDEDAVPLPPTSPNRAKQLQVIAGTDITYELAKRYKLKTAFGTDTLFSQALAQRQGAQLTKLTRWYTPGEALTMATGMNATLLALSGLRNPYPGKLGTIEECALADLLLVDGNPLENIKLIEDPRNFLVIMKDGRIYKNLLSGEGGGTAR
jgi:imidazolonepropionase-like amidohydrolase